jgi:hypothetical protein
MTDDIEKSEPSQALSSLRSEPSPRFAAAFDLLDEMTDALNVYNAKTILQNPDSLRVMLRHIEVSWDSALRLTDVPGTGRDVLPFIDILWRYLNHIAIEVLVVGRIVPLPVSADDLQSIADIVARTFERGKEDRKYVHSAEERYQYFCDGLAALRRLLKQCDIYRSLEIVPEFNATRKLPNLDRPRWESDGRKLIVLRYIRVYSPQAVAISNLLQLFEDNHWNSLVPKPRSHRLDRALRSLNDEKDCPISFHSSGMFFEWRWKAPETAGELP